MSQHEALERESGIPEQNSTMPDALDELLRLVARDVVARLKRSQSAMDTKRLLRPTSFQEPPAPSRDTRAS
jgi:hypothetical protein